MSEGFHLECLQHRTEIVLRPDASILRLQSAEALDRFTKKYARSEPTLTVAFIDWVEVAEQYQGIIIAPYIYARRLTHHTFWYYGWDCASGCVWDKEAVLRTQSFRSAEREAVRAQLAAP